MGRRKLGQEMIAERRHQELAGVFGVPLEFLRRDFVLARLEPLLKPLLDGDASRVDVLAIVEGVEQPPQFLLGRLAIAADGGRGDAPLSGGWIGAVVVANFPRTI